MLHLYDNGHILTRTLLPFLLWLAGNLILGGCGVVGILIAAVIDIIAILVLYSSKRICSRLWTLRFDWGAAIWI